MLHERMLRAIEMSPTGAPLGCGMSSVLSSGRG